MGIHMNCALYSEDFSNIQYWHIQYIRNYNLKCF